MPRRGYKFEAEIKKVLDYIENLGGHAHKNNPSRTVDGIYLSGEPFDFEVFYKDYHAVFDAKEVKGRKWHMLEKDIRQCNELKKCKNAGLQAYFLIYFEGSDVRQIDVDTVITTLRSNSKTISAEDNPSWNLLEVIKNV